MTTTRLSSTSTEGSTPRVVFYATMCVQIERVVDRFHALAQNRRLALKYTV